MGKKITSVSKISVTREEGRLLLAAIACITVSPQVRLYGQTYDGRQLTPDEVFEKLTESLEGMEEQKS